MVVAGEIAIDCIQDRLVACENLAADVFHPFHRSPPGMNRGHPVHAWDQERPRESDCTTHGSDASGPVHSDVIDRQEEEPRPSRQVTNLRPPHYAPVILTCFYH